MNLSEKLIKLRKEKGLSQEQFGYEINVSRQAVSKWESGQSKPDTDKIKEIVKFYGVTYEYLLDDDAEENNDVSNIEKEGKSANSAEIKDDTSKENLCEYKIEKGKIKEDENKSSNTEKEINENSNKKKKSKSFLKVIFVLVIIYLLIVIYKFVVLTIFYNIGNSFSENNFSIFENIEFEMFGETEVSQMYQNVTKIGDYMISYIYYNQSYETPAYITYTDFKNKKEYELEYQEESNTYLYKDLDNPNYFSFDSEEEREEYFYNKENLITGNNEGYITSDIATRIKNSLKPLYFVSLKNREIYEVDLKGNKLIYNFNNDYLIESQLYKSDFYGTTRVTFSYDYVQEHFENREITEPLETYKDMIVYE